MDSEKIYFLLADVGATFSRLLLKSVLKSNKEIVELIKDQSFKSSEEKSLEEMIRKFVEPYIGKPEFPSLACLALAGPLEGTFVKITNVPHWPIFDYVIASKNLNIPNIKILNNFEANGYGILNMDLSKALKINDRLPVEGAPKAFIGTGTGLGEGIATKGMHSKNYTVYPSEGGHTDFAPRDQLEYGLLTFIKKKYNIDRVSVERCCSGLAIGFIYEYLLEYFKGKKVSCLFENQGKDFSKISNEMIFENALDQKDEVCIETLKIFTSIYGAEAGNLSLKVLPYGGLFLMSGITKAIKEYIIKDKTFLQNYLNKGRMGRLLEKVPIYFTDDDVGLKGTEKYALEFLI